MADSVDFDQGALSSAVSQMAAAYAKLSAEFDKVVSTSESLNPNWKTPEGESFISKFEAISTGISNFKASYSSIENFLTSAVGKNYADVEQEIADSLATAGGDQ